MIQNVLLSGFIAQLWLAVLAIAAPVAEETLRTADHGNAWHYGTGGGIVGLIVLILDIIVFGAYKPSIDDLRGPSLRARAGTWGWLPGGKLSHDC